MKRYAKLFHLVGLTLASMLVVAVTAEAQSARNCGPRDAVVDRLADRYGESRRSVGLGSNNALVEVFASDETGSWTITVTSTNGLTCLVASGQAFETIAEALGPQDSGA